MKKNEKGFTYPLTLCLLIVFLLFFSMNVGRLLFERKVAHETETILQQEYYYLSTVKKIEKTIEATGSIPKNGKIPYQEGVMDYKTELPAGDSQKVNFTLRLHSGITAYGSGVFDLQTMKLIKWTELQ
ncbi:hypothetical protein JK635_04070 [Neobacillus sp. YIM B02564]|jgi:hypothetical protein|uniref:Competence protein ComGG n=1 Tax=Neobacillus paridis TaxID=2803862 RepID=A0ABS1TJI6_9BACI|nr:competence type IV pilus minor pilin ComGG [Neobacillus paridis]MBL4951417.1 hypothetical protein [Neobacillus paridis]